MSVFGHREEAMRDNLSGLQRCLFLQVSLWDNEKNLKSFHDLHSGSEIGHFSKITSTFPSLIPNGNLAAWQTISRWDKSGKNCSVFTMKNWRNGIGNCEAVKNSESGYISCSSSFIFNLKITDICFLTEHASRLLSFNLCNCHFAKVLYEKFSLKYQTIICKFLKHQCLLRLIRTKVKH